MNRKLRIAAVVIVLIVIAAAVWWKLGSRPAVAAAATAQNSATVQRGNVQSTVDSAGNITPAQQVTLNFQQSGIVKSVNVASGDAVKKGEVLAQLDTSSLDLQVKNAEVNLKLAQDKLNQALNPNTPQDITTAKAQVDAAQAALDKLSIGPTSSDLAAAQAAVASAQAAYTAAVKASGTQSTQLAADAAAVEKAQVALQQAQAAYDKVQDSPNIGMLPQSTALQQATIDYQTALANYQTLATTAGADANSSVQQSKSALQQARDNLAKLTAPPTRADLAAAQAQLTQAQDNLAKLQAGPDATAVDIAQNGVVQAQIALQQAQLAQKQAQIVSPIDGIVSAVNAIAGQNSPSDATGAVQIADIGHLEIILDLAETDVDRVRAGQTAEISLDALPNSAFTGTVSEIAPVGVTQQGVVNYPVTVQLANTPAGVKAGMSAIVNIVVAQRDNVLMVPNRAVQLTRTGVAQNGAAGGATGETPTAGGSAGANTGAGSGSGQQSSSGVAAAGGQGQSGQHRQGAGGGARNAGTGNFQGRPREGTVTVLQKGLPVQIQVQVGLVGDTMTEIVSGLTEGQVVLLNQAAAASQGGGGRGGFIFPGRFGG